jgi:tripartite-type tricarboxylate transporter receptor subunit TctC
MSALPDIPAIAETLPGFSSLTWIGVVAPPQTPRDIVDKVSADIAEAIGSQDIRNRFADLSAEPVGNTPQAAARFMADEVRHWRAVIKAAGVTLE